MKIGEYKTVPSLSREGVSYTVYKTLDGYKCTCPDFSFNQHKCKHIKKLQHLKYK